MRSLIIASGALAAFAAPQAATAQTVAPVQRVDIPPSRPAPVDPFKVDPLSDAVAEAAASVVGDTAMTDPERQPPVEDGTESAKAPGAALPESSAPAEMAERVDAIMKDLFGPSEEEQRAMAAKLYAEQMAQIERDRLAAQRVETLNREARERVEAENARRLAEYRAEVERVNSEYEARLAAWRERVARCEAGDETACGAP